MHPANASAHGILAKRRPDEGFLLPDPAASDSSPSAGSRRQPRRYRLMMDHRVPKATASRGLAGEPQVLGESVPSKNPDLHGSAAPWPSVPTKAPSAPISTPLPTSP